MEGHVPHRRRLLLDARLSAGIAFLAAGMLSPVATLVLVLLTLFGALPMYRPRRGAQPARRRAASRSSRSCCRDGAARRWFCASSGFAATGFMITITLSAADATAHMIENPSCPPGCGIPMPLTLVLLAALGAVFLKGFREAVGLAVPIVAVYLALTSWSWRGAFGTSGSTRTFWRDWRQPLIAEHGSPLSMIAGCPAAVSEARARPLRLRDGRRGDAARPRAIPTIDRDILRAASGTRRSCSPPRRSS